MRSTWMRLNAASTSRDGSTWWRRSLPGTDVGFAPSGNLSHQAQGFLGATRIDPLEGEPAGLNQQVVAQCHFLIKEHQAYLAPLSFGFHRGSQAVSG